ncbi:MAG: aminomethyltransferase family protein [Ardenticatenaceae bacterium]
MAGTELKIISSCARSPFFKCTRDRTVNYGECSGRLTPLSLGRSKVEEYWTLRTAAGLYDVPERPLEIRGPDAVGFLNRMFTRPIETLRVNRGRYALLCDHRGGMVCDGVLFRLEEQRFWYVHADGAIYTWMMAFADGYDIEIVDPNSWALQIQGPRALDILEACCDDGAPKKFRYFHCAQVKMGGQPVLISRTGWTGELGFEIYNLEPNVDGPALWTHLVESGRDFGMLECGTLGMNCRRIEAGILNYGTDMNDKTTPYDMGLGQFVELDQHDFVGRDALAGADKRTRFTGFKCPKGNIRWGSSVLQNGSRIGLVKAFDHSPYLKCGVGFVLLDSPDFMDATGLTIVDRQGQERPIELTALPFYDAKKRIPRGLETVEFEGVDH